MREALVGPGRASRVPHSSLEVDAACAGVLLVGEANPYSSRPELALWHEPRGAAGDHLRRRALGLTAETYGALWRVNLCDDGMSWNREYALRRAAALLPSDHGEPRPWSVVVALGLQVSRAFAMAAGYRKDFARLWLSWPWRPGEVWETGVLCLPHPSGRSRAWDDAANGERARALLRDLAPGVLWGEEVPS